MLRARSFWVAFALISYLAAALARLGPELRQRAAIAFGLGTVTLAVGWWLVSPPRLGLDRIAPTARSAARLVVAGAVMVLVVAFAPAFGSVGSFAVVRAVGLAMASLGSLIALLRLSSFGGVAHLTQRRRSTAIYLLALVWAMTLLSVVAWSFPGLVPLPSVGEQRAQFMLLLACTLGVLINMASAFAVYSRRRFELAVGERAAAALWLAAVALLLGFMAVLMEVAHAVFAMPVVLVAASLGVVAASVSQRPTRVSRFMRTSAALTMLCAPVASVAVVAAYKAPTHAGLIVFLVTIWASLSGAVSLRFARRLGPSQGVWLRVLKEALSAAKSPDPQQAVVAVLCVIRDGLGANEGPAALYRFASGDRLTVDRAGYLHEEVAQVPATVVALASQEPEGVLAAEAMRYAQVAKPEVRAALAWLDARGAGAVALVVDEEVQVGVLLWPAAGRVTPLAYEEVVHLRLLAEHLGSVTGAAAQLRRSRARELEASQTVQATETRLDKLRDVIARHADRQRAQTQLLARPVELACYSPAAQSTRTALERLGARGDNVRLLVPPGVDGVGWAALFHLASPRADEALVVVDASLTSEQTLQRWQQAEESPLLVATAGTLVLRDPQALSEDAQRYIGNALPASTALVVLLPRGAEQRSAAARFEPHFINRLGDETCALPTLAERSEDLRALGMHFLACIGMRQSGRPLGLSLQAQQLVVEYDWPGNELELEASLLKAALRCSGDVIDVADLAPVIGSAVVSGPQRAIR